MAAPKKRAGGDGATSQTPRTRRKRAQVEAGSRGLGPGELGATPPPEEVRALADTVAEDGGQVLCSYCEPLGGAWVLLAALPIERLEPTPFQRDLSKAHVERLRQVMERLDRFLDPVIAVRQEGHYWTPNGRHRLEALRLLGARSIVALLVVDPAIAYRILALNTEKAHNLRERALEVVRMAADLARRQPGRRESEFALEFEEAALVTLGLCYEERPRFAAGAYHPLVRRIDTFLDEPLPAALERRRGACPRAPHARRSHRVTRGGAQGAGPREPVPAQPDRGTHQPAPFPARWLGPGLRGDARPRARTGAQLRSVARRARRSGLSCRRRSTGGGRLRQRGARG